jgi:hypothetical protein
MFEALMSVTAKMVGYLSAHPALVVCAFALETVAVVGVLVCARRSL